MYVSWKPTRIYISCDTITQFFWMSNQTLDPSLEGVIQLVLMDTPFPIEVVSSPVKPSLPLSYSCFFSRLPWALSWRSDCGECILLSCFREEKKVEFWVQSSKIKRVGRIVPPSLSTPPYQKRKKSFSGRKIQYSRSLLSVPNFLLFSISLCGVVTFFFIVKAF